MNLLRKFRKSVKPILPRKEPKPIVLNEQEQKLFEQIKQRPAQSHKEKVMVEFVNDKQLSGKDCFFMPHGDKFCSLQEMKHYVAAVPVGEFVWLILSRKADIKQWVIDMFDQPVLAEQLINSKSKEEFIAHLEHFLKPETRIEEKSVENSGFNKMLENLNKRFEEVKQSVREARKQGVNTFIPQTKIMNIKSKIEFASIAQDESELVKISTLLDDILSDLKKEDDNARTRAET